MTETSSHPALAPADAPARNRLAVAALVIAAASVVAAAGVVMAALALGPDFAALLFVAAAYIVPLLLSVVALALGIAALGRHVALVDDDAGRALVRSAHASPLRAIRHDPAPTRRPCPDTDAAHPPAWVRAAEGADDQTIGSVSVERWRTCVPACGSVVRSVVTV